jgi:deferrochelatase/peroxidase EfeB
MTQAKGILPKHDEDTRTLFANPKTCGYFIGVTLRPDLDRAGAQEWLRIVTALVDDLVARLPAAPDEGEGEKVAAVAVGLSPSFFAVNGTPRFDPPITTPAGFETGSLEDQNPMVWDSPGLQAVPRMSVDVLFYVVSVFEARVARFVEQLQATAPDVTTTSIDRGYQRVDGDEPFGYKDGVRNVLPRTGRPGLIFVHPEREVEEPRAADGGSYLAYMRIEQHRPAFTALADEAARDSVIGRHRDGTRLDLQGVDPKHEPADPAPELPPSAHVRKAGPRGTHDDVQIFRRGLPYLDVDGGGVRVGLNFASFQSSLDQLDTVLNDWILAPNFPVEGAGPDRLLDPVGGLTSMQKIGLFFVPSHDSRHLAATLFDPPRRPPKTGRLVVRKRVVDPTDPHRRFERRGFVFRIVDASGQQIGGEFVSGTNGRAVFGSDLAIGETYTVTEVSSPIAVAPIGPVTFQMSRPNMQVRIVNTVAQPNTPYGG